MIKIATVMAVAGSERYFEFAKVSIPSFLRSNQTDLFVFTDNVDAFRDLRDLKVVDFKECFKHYPGIIKSLKEKISADHRSNIKRCGFEHDHLWIAALLPIAQEFLRNEYSHILKVDCDGFFVGNIMELLEKDITGKDYDLYLVERKHPWMNIYSGGMPGVGFTLWRKQGNFIKKYLKNFKYEQATILRLMKERIVRTMILSRPGYHFVYPFQKRPQFSKKDAEQFLPAYFHLHGKDADKNLKTMFSWFG